MKRRSLVWLFGIVAVIILATVSIKYLHYENRKKKFSEIEKKIYDSKMLIPWSIYGYLQTNFDYSRIVPKSLNQLLDFVSSGFTNDLERENLIFEIKKIYLDPWANDSSFFRIMPVFNHKYKFPIGNIIISCGIDGKMNISNKIILYDDSLSDATKFYNYKDFNIIGEGFLKQTKPNLSFKDFLFGKRDFIVLYIDYYRCKDFPLSYNKIESLNEYTIRNVKGLEKNGIVYTSIKSFIQVEEYSNEQLGGYLYGDSSYYVKSLVLSSPCDLEFFQGNIIVLDAIFSNFDSISNIIYFEKGLVYPLEIKD